jgi:hypothetical protein
MSLLFCANFLVFQWFFIRLARIVDTDNGETVGWTWIKKVVPLTGWWNDYIFI